MIKPVAPPTSPERVFVIPRAALFDGGGPLGFAPFPERFDRCLASGTFAVRDEVEENPHLKQIIPYAVVARPATDEIFCFRRHGGGERRLVGRRSIGVGGHLNPIDAVQDPTELVRAGLQREVTEELELAEGWGYRFVGIVNDDTTAVGAVHLGVVAVVEPVHGPVRVRETDTMAGEFVARTKLLRMHRDERGTFETWSALLLDRLDDVLPRQRRRSRARPDAVKSQG